MSRKQKQYHFIYKTTDTRNGNFYVGMHSTDNLNDGYIGSGLRLKKLIYKHGKEIFKIEILEFLPDRESLKKREAEIVNSDLLKEEKCMNLKEGGDGGFTREIQFENNRKSQIKIKNLIETNPEWVEKRKQKYSDARKKEYFYSWKGKTHSNETKDKMSKNRNGTGIGEKNSQFNTCWINNGKENKKIKIDDLCEYPTWVKGRLPIGNVGKNQY